MRRSGTCFPTGWRFTGRYVRETFATILSRALSWNSQDFKGFSEGVSTPVRRVRLGSLSAPWIWMENALDEKHL